MKTKSNPFLSNLLTVATCASFLGSSAMSQAAVTAGDIISVSFRNSNILLAQAVPTGAAVIGDIDNVWNDITSLPSSSTALKDVSNVFSGVSISITGGGTINGSTTDASNLDVYEGNIFRSTAGTSTITLTGLGAGTKIDLYLYAGAGHTSGEGGTFTFAATPKTATDTSGIETAYTENENYVVFSGLVADGTGIISGTWSRASGQTYSAFAGFQVAVIEVGSSGYTAWANANGATDQTVDQDHDNDGVKNGIEYFMGESGSTFTANPALDASNSITWTMGDAYNGVYGTDYLVQTSSNLTSWDPVDVGDVIIDDIAPGKSLTYTLTGPDKRFVRLLVNPN